ncbi:MAG: hypothetical protein ABSG87_03410 [Verrucomicrobiota bacterium]|jgi:hypothetical protein
MKIKTNIAQKYIIGSAILFFAAISSAQQEAAGRANDFNSVEYYDAPHEQQIKSRLSGSEAQPQSGGLLAIKQLKLETFDVDGKPGIVARAPECVYDTLNNVASSPGHLEVQTGDGKFRVEGDGFLWRQNDSFLTISNHVRTVIENASD